jgi:hypothetical protein
MGKKTGGKKKSSTKLMQEIADSATLDDVINDDEYLISTQDDQCVEERRFLWKIDDGAREFGTRGMDSNDQAFIDMPDKKLLGSTKHQGKLYCSEIVLIARLQSTNTLPSPIL